MQEQLKQYQQLIEQQLAALYCEEDDTQLYASVRYSLLAGGKRLRPVLVLAAAKLCGAEPEQALPFACAIEMVHSYSLIHDDLPAMDDDHLRRGKPTNHLVFGEATAILAGDALLTDAFHQLTRAKLPPECIVSAVEILSRAAGSSGMVLGQAMDMKSEQNSPTAQELARLQSLKTGALFTAAVLLGAAAAGAGSAAQQALEHYGLALGRAFQMQDDVLDVQGEQEAVGKSLGSDQQRGKTTFVSVLGLAECERQVQALTEEAINALAQFEEDDARFLKELAYALIKRTT